LKRSPTKLILVTILLVFPVLGGLALLSATPFGIGIYSDSAMYLLTARSLANGAGWTIGGDPVTVFPPLYPALLAIPALLGGDIIDGARWVQMIIWMANILLSGVLAYRFSRSVTTTLVSCVLVTGAVDLLAYHSIALSDGLFLLFSLLALISLDAFLQNARKGFLIGAAIFIALSALTRYAGFAWIAAGVLTILFYHSSPGNRPASPGHPVPPPVESKARRYVDAALFGILSSIPSAVWAVRNAQYKSQFGRPIGLHPFIGAAEIGGLTHTVSAWVFQWGMGDSPWMFVPFAILATLTIRLVWIEMREGEKSTAGRLRMLLIFSSVYVVTMILSGVFIQADLFRDSARLFIPLHVFLLMALMTCATTRVTNARVSGPSWRISGLAMLIITVMFVTSTARKYIDHIKKDGQGYASNAYRFSPLMKKLSAIPSGITVYSNLDLPVTLFAGRILMAIPEKIDNASQQLNVRYDEGMKSMAADIRDSSALLVYFRDTDNWLVFPSVGEIARFVPLRAVDAEPDGVIYEALPDTTGEE